MRHFLYCWNAIGLLKGVPIHSSFLWGGRLLVLVSVTPHAQSIGISVQKEEVRQVVPYVKLRILRPLPKLLLVVIDIVI